MTDVGHSIDTVLSLLREIGIDANGLAAKDNVFCISREDFAALTNSQNCIGLAVHGTYVLFKPKRLGKIFLLKSLIRPVFEAVLAHEIFHLYSHHNGLELSLVDEEGSAELASYFVFHRLGELSRDHFQASLLHNPDPVYGDGFRVALQRAKQLGGIREYFSNLVPKPAAISPNAREINRFDAFWNEPTSMVPEATGTNQNIWWTSQQRASNPTLPKTWWSTAIPIPSNKGYGFPQSDS